MTPHELPPDPATPPPHPAPPAAEIARRAYATWAARCSSEDHQRRDWLEAEAALALEMATAGQLAEAQERLLRLVAERQQAELRQVAEHDVDRILGSADTIADAAPGIARSLCENLDWDACVVWLVDPEAGLLRCLEVWRAPDVESDAFERDARSRTFAAGAGLPGRVWAGGVAAWTPDPAADPDRPGGAVEARGGLRAAAAFPVRTGNGVLAVLELFSVRARRPDERHESMMGRIGGQIGQFVERREAEARLQRQEHDRRIGREIQQGMLPKVVPRLAGFEIGGRSVAPNVVGGDCFDFIPLPGADPDGTGILVADASGHGIGAALLVSEARAYLRGVATTAADVGLLLDLTNRCLCTDPMSVNFVTALLVRLDPGTRSLSYAGAGHLPGYVLDPRGVIRATLPSSGPPLGIDPANTFPAYAFPLEPGDLVLLLTDGIVEAARRGGEPFGIGRTLGLVREHRRRTPDEILAALFSAVLDYCTNNCLDDLTAVVLKVGGDRDPAPPGDQGPSCPSP